MATVPKSKKTVSSRPNTTAKNKGVVASKKRGLSKKQWGIIGIVGILVLAVGGYFGFQYYQDISPNAAGWTTVGTNKIGKKNESYGTVKVYACKEKSSGAYRITVKEVTTGLYGDRNAINKSARVVMLIANTENGWMGDKIKALGAVGTVLSFTPNRKVSSDETIRISSESADSVASNYYPGVGWSLKVSSIKGC